MVMYLLTDRTRFSLHNVDFITFDISIGTDYQHLSGVGMSVCRTIVLTVPIIVSSTAY